MRFTKIPEPFASVQGELSYTFAEATEEQVVLSVVDVRTGARLGVKQLFHTTSGSTDIAPMVRKNIRFVPSEGPTGIYDTTNRSALIEVRAATGQRSDMREFLPCRIDGQPAQVLTTMPRRRIIARGEIDEITILAPDGFWVEITTDRGYATTMYYTGGESISLFRLETDYFEPGTGTITLKFVAQETVVHQIDYTVVPATGTGRRLAWQSTAGSIEHYTFPVVKSEVEKIEKGEVYTAADGYISTSTTTERTTTLLSAYEPVATIEALAAIAASPRVWLVTGERYDEVDVLPAEQIVRRHGSLRCVEIEYRPKFKKRSLQ